ncbi:MAG: SsrA-binding protein SmpB [Deltaproteobacteria bacterium]|nr:SsrA-binding protein SmpB [Deltaproteobacteria bacterium]
MTKEHIKLIAKNKKARHDYFIEDKFEAGIQLLGTEVKSMRLGKVNLKESYVKIRNGEVYIYQMHIGAYPFAYYENHEPKRTRKLLLHKYEIKKLFGKINEKGAALIPLEAYFKDGKVKIEIAVAKGKKKYDKREAIKSRDQKRDMERSHYVSNKMGAKWLRRG